MQAVKKGSMFVIYTTPITESVKGLEALPILYKEYQDVFWNKEWKYASSTPFVWLYNWSSKSTQSPFGPIYNLSQNKLIALQE